MSKIVVCNRTSNKQEITMFVLGNYSRVSQYIDFLSIISVIDER